MKTFVAEDVHRWRAWLEEHHATASEVWLVFYKRVTGRPTIEYGDAVREALCFGWIDSAKQEETKARRLQEAIRMLTARRPLGLK